MGIPRLNAVSLRAMMHDLSHEAAMRRGGNGLAGGRTAWRLHRRGRRCLLAIRKEGRGVCVCGCVVCIGRKDLNFVQ